MLDMFLGFAQPPHQKSNGPPLRPNSRNRQTTVRRLTPRISATAGVLKCCSMRNSSCSFGMLNFGPPGIPVNIVSATWELVETIIGGTSFVISRNKNILWIKLDKSFFRSGQGSLFRHCLHKSKHFTSNRTRTFRRYWKRNCIFYTQRWCNFTRWL